MPLQSIVCHFKWKICFTYDLVASVHSITLSWTGAHHGISKTHNTKWTVVNCIVCKATSSCDLPTQWVLWVCLHPTFAFWFLGYCICCFEWFNLRTTWYTNRVLEHKLSISQWSSVWWYKAMVDSTVTEILKYVNIMHSGCNIRNVLARKHMSISQQLVLPIIVWGSISLFFVVHCLFLWFF
jgi:hypothetical protein